MPSATVTSKGQITIPSEIRKAFNISSGDEIIFFDLGNGQVAFRPRTGSIRDLKGIVPKLDYVPTIEELDEGIAAAVEDEYLASVRRDPASTSKDEAA
jgi:AbrB family looped-hinge helix DNA binding protein